MAPCPSLPSLARALDSEGGLPPSRSPTSDRGGLLRIATACAPALGPYPRAPASVGSAASACDLGPHDPRAANSQGNVPRSGPLRARTTDMRVPNGLFGSPIRPRGEAFRRRHRSEPRRAALGARRGAGVLTRLSDVHGPRPEAPPHRSPRLPRPRPAPRRDAGRRARAGACGDLRLLRLPP